MSLYNVIRNSVSAKRWMLSSALTAVSMAAIAVPTQAADPTHSWAGLNQDAGSFTTDAAAGNVTNIKLNTDRAIGSGDANIYTGHTVNVDGALLAVRDTKSDPTQILGNLNSNGKIIIIDANGVFFGKHSQVDVAGLIATTGNIDNSQILNNDFGDYVIDNINGGSIELSGVVNIAEAGLAAFVSPFVTNSGIINAKMGKVVMASGEKVTLDLYGDGLFEVAVEGELSDALIENKGTINAEGGIVQISALAAKDAVDNIINMDGIVNVSSVTQKGGKIILSGGSKGKVEVSGALVASGATDGGSVKATGQNVDVTQDAVVVADAGENGDGGTAYFYGDDYTIFSGMLSARGGSVSGNGGNAEISAGESVGYYGYADLSAVNGEVGTLLIDPEHLTISDAAFDMDWDAFWSAGLDGNININDQALANTLHVANVNLWATETLSTASDINISEYDYDVLNTHGTWKPWKWTVDNMNGITGNTLTVAAPEVNLVHDITLGNGALNVADLTTADSVLGFDIVNPPHDIIVDELNLDGRIYKRASLGDASFTTLADDTQISTTADTINLLSNNASIQQAVQFADASGAEVETVNVAAGTYTENLVIDRAVKLSGADGATIQAASAGKLITVTADNVNIDPFTFDGLGLAANGIYADGADYLIVDGNTFTGFTNSNININNSAIVKLFDNTMTGANTGIYADNAYDIKIYDNTVTNAAVTGIHVLNTDGTNYVNDVDVWGNTISSSNTTTTGVLVENSAYATVGVTDNNPFASGYADGNKISGGGDGIVIANSDQAVARYNTVSNVGEDGIDIIGSQDVVVTLNTVNGTANGNHNDGISVSGGSSNVEVSKNTVLNSGWDGIYTGSSTGTKIIENDVSGSNQVGITVLNNNAGTLVQDNTVSDSQRGILVKSGASDTTIIGNVVYDQTLDGIHAEGDSSLEVVGNYVGYTDKAGTAGALGNITGDGIYLKDTDGALVNSNYVTQARGNGVSVTNGDDVTVSNNKIDDAANAGIYVTSSDDAQIRGNEINDNGASTYAQYGILVEGGHSVDIDNNKVEETSVAGIAAYNTSYIDIDGNLVKDGRSDGIVVSGGRGADIRGNTVKNHGGDGIELSDNSFADIHGNHVYYSGDDGIDVDRAYRVDIVGNHVHGTRFGNGIEVTNSFDADVARNHVHYTGQNGVYLENSDFAEIRNNDVHNTGNDGIDVRNSYKVDIAKNDIKGTRGDGVQVRYSNNVDVAGNTIRYAGDDGIDVENSNNAVIKWNSVTGSRNNGIEVNGGSNEFIWANFTAWNGGNGIEVTNNRGNVLIYSNIAMGNHDNGIYVNGAPHVEISGNYASGNWSNGIYAKNISASTTLIVNGNVTHNNGEDGIKASNLNTAYINNNRSYDNGDDGIDVDSAYHVEIRNNDVYGNGFGNMQQTRSSMPEVKIAYEQNEGHGIEVSNIYGNRTLMIDDNNIHNNAVDGVNVENASRIIITDNNIFSNGDDGIDINWSNHAEIVDNNIFGNGYGMPAYTVSRGIKGFEGFLYRENEGNGIEASNVYGRGTLIVDDNNIYANRSNGIEATDADVTYILDNNIYENGAHGLAMLGRNNGNVVVAGNNFINNPIGALFESGYIDISNLLEPNNFTNTDPSATPVGMVFDGGNNVTDRSSRSIGPIGGQLSIVGNTLGATEFSGFQNAGSFYVRIEDGSLLDGSGSPIIIDGLNATFDGITPIATDGILEAAVLNYIEDRLYDADDSPVNGRGQIFVGEAPVGIDNIEDFFNRFFGFNPGSGRLNVTIAGLPLVGPGGAGAPNAAALNLIAPAAGGDDQDEQSADELANIEPAAGEERVSCWSDAISAASGGATVNYSFGGSFEEALADASSCSVTGL